MRWKEKANVAFSGNAGVMVLLVTVPSLPSAHEARAPAWWQSPNSRLDLH